MRLAPLIFFPPRGERGKKRKESEAWKFEGLLRQHRRRQFPFPWPPSSLHVLSSVSYQARERGTNACPPPRVNNTPERPFRVVCQVTESSQVWLAPASWLKSAGPCCSIRGTNAFIAPAQRLRIRAGSYSVECWARSVWIRGRRPSTSSPPVLEAMEQGFEEKRLALTPALVDFFEVRSHERMRRGG